MSSDSVIRWFESSYPSHLCTILAYKTPKPCIFLYFDCPDFLKLGKNLGKLFGVNFYETRSEVPASRLVMAGKFVFSISSKLRLGKFLQVVHLFGFMQLKIFRVVRVDGGRDRAAQRVSRPDADDLGVHAALLATADERVPKLVRVMMREQPLHACCHRVDVRPLGFLKVDVG